VRFVFITSRPQKLLIVLHHSRSHLRHHGKRGRSGWRRQCNGRGIGYSSERLKHLACKKTANPIIQNSGGDAAVQAREKALIWKQDLHIIPLSAAIYLLCYLDRSNIGTLFFV
jgi:hypothetical protein